MYNLLSSDSMISLSRYSLLESCFVCRCLCANKWSSFYLFLVRVHPPSSLLRPSSLVWETVNLAAYGSTIGVSIAVCHCPLMCLYQICLRKYACVSVSRLHMRACLPIIFVKSVFISVWHDMTSSPSRTHHKVHVYLSRGRMLWLCHASGDGRICHATTEVYRRQRLLPRLIARHKWLVLRQYLLNRVSDCDTCDVAGRRAWSSSKH